MTATTNNNETYYDVLGVARTADASQIRKAYLKQSLAWHPDKNTQRVEEAKARFVQIGQAYETLSDATLRAQYDSHLRFGGSGNFGTTSNGFGTTPTPPPTAAAAAAAAAAAMHGNDAYDDYLHAFDGFVAGLSEEELAALLGVASIVGSVVGGMMGRRLVGSNRHASAAARGSSAAAATDVLSTVGSLVGSHVASHVAASSVRAVQAQSQERLEWRQARNAALSRGEAPPPPPSSRAGWKETLERAFQHLQGNAGATQYRSAHPYDHGGGAADAQNADTHQQQPPPPSWTDKVMRAVEKAAEEAAKANQSRRHQHHGY